MRLLPAPLARLVFKTRNALSFVFPRLSRRIRRRIPGRFQPYSFTLENRYPWMFEFAASNLPSHAPLKVMSFGCSRGDEVFTLRRYFPHAMITGIDVDPLNIAVCRDRLLDAADDGIEFRCAADTRAEPSAAYDAIFCLAVLCLADLTIAGRERSDPWLLFTDFEYVIEQFSRCLKPGGLLFLHTTNFRFCDTKSCGNFDTVLEARPENMAMDAIFDRNNQLMPGARYRPVAFRKCT